MDGMPSFEPMETLQEYTICRTIQGKDARAANKDGSDLQYNKETTLGFDKVKVGS